MRCPGWPCVGLASLCQVPLLPSCLLVASQDGISSSLSWLQGTRGLELFHLRSEDLLLEVRTGPWRSQRFLVCQALALSQSTDLGKSILMLLLEASPSFVLLSCAPLVHQQMACYRWSALRTSTRL